jgi:hypothetical protein
MNRKGIRQSDGYRPGHENPFTVLLYENEAESNLGPGRRLLDIKGLQNMVATDFLGHTIRFMAKVLMELALKKDTKLDTVLRKRSPA